MHDGPAATLVAYIANSMDPDQTAPKGAQIVSSLSERIIVKSIESNIV